MAIKSAIKNSNCKANIKKEYNVLNYKGQYQEIWNNNFSFGKHFPTELFRITKVKVDDAREF